MWIAISALCGRRTEDDHNPGRELAGTVVQAYGIAHVREGQRVLQVIYGCGHCTYCVQGDPKHRADGMGYLQDAHSEYVVAPAMCLVPLPDDLDWGSAVLLCGDTLGTPYHALKRLGGVHTAQTAAILWCGPIGLGCLTWLRFYGARAAVSEAHPYRRELARRLGADLVLDPTEGHVVERRDCTPPLTAG